MSNQDDDSVAVKKLAEEYAAAWGSGRPGASAFLLRG